MIGHKMTPERRRAAEIVASLGHIHDYRTRHGGKYPVSADAEKVERLENELRALRSEAGYLTTELLTVLSLSIIPVTLVVVWVAKVAGMVAGV